MEVIGTVESGTYLCRVSHTEIEKYLNLYYNKKDRLKVGDVVNLGQGYDFLRDAEVALKKTEEFIAANKHVIETIVTGISVMSRREKDNERKSR